jgi:predicted dehydrogenase
VRLKPELAGGSAWDVGVYPNSYSIVAAGGRAPAAVWAQQEIGETGVEVAMRAQLRFDGGTGSTVAQISSGFRTPAREGAFFVGEEGIITVPEPWKPGVAGVESRIHVTNLDNETETIVIPPIDPYICEVQAMEACVLDGAAPVVPLSLSREFVKSILAMYESAATGQVVEIGD